MSIIIKIFATLVALEFFYIMYLETFATQSDATSRVFNMDQAELSRSSVTTLFKNQGVYNGLLAVLILVASFIHPDLFWLRTLLVYIIAVAAHGGATSQPAILFKQGGLAIITLILSFIF
ncbi:DUF1304 domain-containing protein [Eremococcus coleocola]|uniref:DUF1304 domain-containing protein n=1 Tax=Eremococcus coleocola ACS-139-V-Col8 TaxID=908337 RepID=E4KPT9_9LACT|nr:DUF1304 family protein [Eremococcus coleocola]EFR31211.1 hypothetical protein HMPREF9257_1578 [Eremococcus coleocola ACS-139-V-Col8]